MNELALFAGVGGGILGSILSGWRTVCAVEIDSYCREVLMARQDDGWLNPFPIWDDVRTFDGTQWKGIVDVVSGGFPCKSFSTASRGRVTAIDLWPEMLRIVSEVEPRYVFAENVKQDPILQACRDLGAIGYSSCFTSLPASLVGAPHVRERWWMVAYADCDSEPRRAPHGQLAGVQELPGMVDWEEDISRTLGMDDGVANRMDRLKAIGNGQVDSVAALAWSLLRPAD